MCAFLLCPWRRDRKICNPGNEIQVAIEYNGVGEKQCTFCWPRQRTCCRNVGEGGLGHCLILCGWLPNPLQTPLRQTRRLFLSISYTLQVASWRFTSPSSANHCGAAHGCGLHPPLSRKSGAKLRPYYGLFNFTLDYPLCAKIIVCDVNTPAVFWHSITAPPVFHSFVSLIEFGKWSQQICRPYIYCSHCTSLSSARMYEMRP